MSVNQLPGQLLSVFEWLMMDVARRVQSGTRWDVAVEQSLLGAMSFAPAIAAEVWDEVKGGLLAAGESFMKLAAVHVQPGYENVTSSDTAKDKVGADLVASGDALPEN